jgi:hypothetical protein
VVLGTGAAFSTSAAKVEPAPEVTSADVAAAAPNAGEEVLGKGDVTGTEEDLTRRDTRARKGSDVATAESTGADVILGTGAAAAAAAEPPSAEPAPDANPEGEFPNVAAAGTTSGTPPGPAL